MTSGKRAVIGGTVVMLLAVGGELLWMHHQRNEDWKPPTPAVAESKVDPDEMVFLKKQRPSSLADVKQMIGTTVWMSAGGQFDYYPYAAHQANYAKAAGTLMGADQLLIKDAFEQVAPKSATYRIPGGDKQVLLAFTMPKSANPTKVYAMPVGYREGSDYTFSNDDIFFYDDPHQLYNYWGPKIWQAVDAHQIVLGMNERQVGLSVGQVSKSLSKTYGDRLVIFDNGGKPMAVTFVKNQVTSFQPDQGY
jgi:hypothetical protein